MAVLDCVNEPEYIVDPVVGVEPSSVYLIVAPEVPVVIVIVTEFVYIPSAGVITGVSTEVNFHFIFPPRSFPLFVAVIVLALVLASESFTLT